MVTQRHQVWAYRDLSKVEDRRHSTTGTTTAFIQGKSIILATSRSTSLEPVFSTALLSVHRRGLGAPQRRSDNESVYDNHRATDNRAFLLFAARSSRLKLVQIIKAPPGFTDSCTSSWRHVKTASSRKTLHQMSLGLEHHKKL